jgi:chromosome segregation ATPase
MSKLDTSIKEIEELLKQRSIKIDTMMNTTASSREKLKLINQKMNIEEEKLLNLIMEITESEQDVSTLDSKEVLNKRNELTKKINKVLDNLRKIRNSLADIIRTE